MKDAPACEDRRVSFLGVPLAASAPMDWLDRCGTCPVSASVLWVSAFFLQSSNLTFSSGLSLEFTTDWIHARSGNQAAPLRLRRIDMKNKKEQKTKSQLRNGKKTNVQSASAKIERPAPESKRTIKQVVVELISANNAITNEEMIATVKTQFPKSAFKDTLAAWYRSQARKGLLTDAPISIPAQTKKQSKAAN
jgi:hypothetical protein